VKQDPETTPLAAVLALTFVCSMGTGVFWHAVPFIAKHTYDFAQARNLLLSLAMGGVYTIGAFTAGRLTRWIEHRLSARGVLRVSVTTLSVVCLAPLLVRDEWALWLAALGGTYVTSLIWPVIESYVTAGRHGASMRSALGWFNLTWAPAVAVPMFAMAPILGTHGQWAIGGFASIGLLGLVALRWFAAQPGHHDRAVADTHVGAEYLSLLHSARVLLPLSYVLNAAMNPILPYRFETLGVDVWWETPAAATWIVVRVVVFAVMWRLPFWHGRWGTLLLGAVAMTAGFGLIVTGPTIAWVLTGLACLGVGLGVVYYAALYYAMAVGHAQVEAGGTHEALIGAGYTVGPAAGLTGSAIAGSVGIVGVVWALVGLAGIPAVRPYLSARRRRVVTKRGRQP
jgi:hypothetical protein